MKKTLETDEPEVKAARTFTTISGRPIEPLYGPAQIAGIAYPRDLGDPGSASVHPRHPRVDVPRPASGPCASSRASAPRPRRTRASSTCSSTAATGSPSPSTCPRSWAAIPTIPLSLGEVGKCGVAVTLAPGHGDALRRHPARRRHHLDDDQLAGRDDAGVLHPGGREAGRRRREARGDDPGRHPEGVHRPEGVHLPAPAQHADHRGHDPVLHRAHAEVEHDLHLRLPHPRGGLHRGPGAGLHPPRRDRVRAVVRGRGDGRGRFAPALSASSSTRTPTSSRRSRSSGRRAASGRAS